MKWVPTSYVQLTERMLTNRTTTLTFDDFSSDPIPLSNGTTQGCCLSMLFYGFYNAPLFDLPPLPNETLSGFVDDAAYLGIGHSVPEAHNVIRNMMSRPHGAFDWSTSHNSPFELSKLVLMNFPRPYANDPEALRPLSLPKPNPTADSTEQTIHPAASHRYLSLIFDPKLRWNLHHSKVLASAVLWTTQVARLGRQKIGLPPEKIRRLYLSVAMPRITYAADIWYTPVSPSESNPTSRSGSVRIAQKLGAIQRRALITLSGALRSTASDLLETHANILPMHLALNKACCRSAIRLASLPPSHPLFKTVIRAASRYVKSHRSPLHEIFHFSKLTPSHTEKILPSRFCPNFTPAVSTSIASSRHQATSDAKKLHLTHNVRVFSDGSMYIPLPR